VAVPTSVVVDRGGIARYLSRGKTSPIGLRTTRSSKLSKV
jgi:hypothetical protein